MAEADGPVSPQEVVARSVGGAAGTALVGLLGRAAGLLVTVLVTHYVSTAEYGNANLAMIVAAVVNAMTLLAPQQALLTRHDSYDEAARLVHCYVAWSGLLSAALLGLCGRWILLFLGQPEATPILLVYCVALGLERAGTVPMLGLRYHLRFLDVARVEMAGDLAYVGVTVAAALLDTGGLCLALGMVARHFLRLVLLCWLQRGKVWPAVPSWGQRERQLSREVFSGSWPLYLGGFGDFLSLYLDNVLVGKAYLAAAQGLYAVGYTLIMTPAETVGQYGATAMVRALSLKDATTRRQTYLSGLRYVSFLLFPIAAGSAMVAHTLEQALLPPRWQGIAPIVGGLFAAAMSTGIGRMAFVHLTAVGRVRWAALCDGMRLLLFLLALTVVMRLDPGRTHMPLVAWGVAVAFTLSSLLGLFLSLRADDLTLADAGAALLPPALGVAVMSALLWVLQWGLYRLSVPAHLGRLALEVLFGAGVYVAYFRLCHRAIYRQTVGWLRGQMTRG